MAAAYFQGELNVYFKSLYQPAIKLVLKYLITLKQNPNIYSSTDA
nr:hypothetical protein [Mucilaginibacter sp. FT3.2]